MEFKIFQSSRKYYPSIIIIKYPEEEPLTRLKTGKSSYNLQAGLTVHSCSNE